MFAVNPKKDCPHVQLLVAGIENVSIDISLPCGVCQDKSENWLCLKCSEVYCSRYVEKHMVHHNTQNPSHEIALSFSDLSFWCYACDSYIDSPHLVSILQAATMAIDVQMHVPSQKLKSEAHPQASGESSHKDQQTMTEESSDHQVSGESSDKDPQPTAGESSDHQGSGESSDKDPQATAGESSDHQGSGESFHLERSLEKEVLLSRIRATIYGNCIGDAIGLLTEFMTKEEAQEADILDFVQKFKVWTETGYMELGDCGGIGIGRTTFQVISQRNFLTDPHKCAYQVWDESGRWAAPNGGVKRTSILGIQDFSDIPTVIHNTRQICKVTHADPRCIASCVAVTTAIALMLQGKHCKGHGYDEQAICKEAYKYACEELDTEEEKEELHRHMFAKSLSELELSDTNKIGYTYKCLGAGFWAYRQKDFRLALTELVMEAGDADTNGAVAGALLGCKLGVEHLPDTWLNGLLHKKWLDRQIHRYLVMMGLEEPM